MTAAAQKTTQGWHARLELGFAARGGRSVLVHRAHRGPLQVQRAFYPEGADCSHVYVLHPPGGVVGGDELHIDIRVEQGAHALVTTPAAGKFYRSAGATAAQALEAYVAENAALEWLPQETIVYDGARVDGCLRVNLASNARFIGWEMLCLGRPGAGEIYAHGEMQQTIELRRDGIPVVMERAHYAGDMLAASWGMGGQPVAATLLATANDKALLQRLRDIIDAHAPTGLAAATQLDEIVACRYLGGDMQEARNLFIDLWRVLRPHVLNRDACVPRIWMT